jgi:hypothetical protein
MNNATIMTASNVAAELYMRQGYEIMRIEPNTQYSPGSVDITGDVWVTVRRDACMQVCVMGLSGSLSTYPWRKDLDSVIMDLASALSF